MHAVLYQVNLGFAMFGCPNHFECHWQPCTSGIPFMFSLGDMLLFEANASQLHLRMLEEVPAALSLSLCYKMGF